MEAYFDVSYHFHILAGSSCVMDFFVSSMLYIKISALNTKQQINRRSKMGFSTKMTFKWPPNDQNLCQTVSPHECAFGTRLMSR